MQNFVKGAGGVPAPAPSSRFEAVVASAPARVPKQYLAHPAPVPVQAIPTPAVTPIRAPAESKSLTLTPRQKKKEPRLHAAPSGAMRRQVTVYLPADKLKKLQHEAVNLELSQSDIVEAAIDAYFAAQKA